MAEKKHQEKHSRYERARIIGNRALQISMGAPFMIKLNDEELAKIRYNPIEIAKIEYEKGLIPSTVKKPSAVGMKKVEK